MRPKSAPSSSRHQEGFLLLGVLFMILLILIALAIAAPKMAESIRRDKEIETVHRGQQYASAIRVFYSKYGRYPNTIDQLMKTDNQRFLRKRYLNPMTGKDDWRIIHLGEAKVAAQGLFGQTMQPNGITPTGATNSTGAPSSNGFGSSSSFGSSGSALGSGSSSLGSSGSGFGGSSSGSSFGAGSSTSPFGGNSGSAFGNSGSSTSPIGGTDASSGSGFGASTGIGGTTTPGANGTPTGIGGTTTTGSSGAFGSPGVTVGGAPIVGVGLLSKKTSIKIYKKQTHYNEWEFVFDPTQNTLDAAGGPGVGGTPTGTGVNNGTGNGFGPGNSTSTFGSSNGGGFGSSSGSGFGSSSGSGFGSSNNGSGSGSSNGSGFGGSPASPVSPTAPVNNSPQ